MRFGRQKSSLLEFMSSEAQGSWHWKCQPSEKSKIFELEPRERKQPKILELESRERKQLNIFGCFLS